MSNCRGSDREFVILDAQCGLNRTGEGVSARKVFFDSLPRAGAILATMVFGVAFAGAQHRVRVPRRTVQVFVAGSRVRFDRVQPLSVGRRILVPLRGVFEKMGATVTYDAVNQRVYAKRGKRAIMLNLNRRVAYVNGEPHRLDTWPKVSKGHVLVPIRFIAEALDATVLYSAPNYTVRITPH